MSDYSDPAQDFKLAHATEFAGISKRNIGIYAMWLSGLGIPESYHEFITAVFITGNWEDVEEDEITLMRMARAISPGMDSTHSIRRAYERLKKSSLRFFEWQEKQEFTVIIKTSKGKARYTRNSYKFPFYSILHKLFHLPLNLPQKQIRAEVSKALGNLLVPPPKPRQRKERKPEAVAACNAKNLEELVALTSSTEAGFHLSEAWRASLGDAIVEEIVRSLCNY